MFFPEDADLDSVREELNDEFEIVEEQIENSQSLLGKTYAYDFVKGEFILDSMGRVIKVDKLAAIMIWVEKILRTTMNRYEIYEYDGVLYDREYGTQIKDLIIGRKLPQLLVYAEIQRELEESLLLHPNIVGIEGYSLEQDGYKGYLQFTLILNDDIEVDLGVNILNGKVERVTR